MLWPCDYTAWGALIDKRHSDSWGQCSPGSEVTSGPIRVSELHHMITAGAWAVYRNWHLTESNTTAPYSTTLTLLISRLQRFSVCEVAALVLHQNPRWVSSGGWFVLLFHISVAWSGFVAADWSLSFLCVCELRDYFQSRFFETSMLSCSFNII